MIRNVVNEMENSYNQDIKQFRERHSKLIAKKSRRASQPINQFFGPGGNNVEKTPKKNAIEARTHSTGEMNAAKGFSSMSNIMTSHKSKFQEDTSSTIELIAENYGANTNNAGALTDAELKAFLNIQKLFTSGTVSIVRSLQFGDIAGAWNLVDDGGSKGRHHTTMETENKVTAIFFSKEKLWDILSKDDKFKKALLERSCD